MQRRFGHLRQRRLATTGHPPHQRSPHAGLHHPTMSISGPTQKPTPLDGFDLRLARMPSYMTSKSLLFVSSRARNFGLDTDSGKIGGRPVLASDAGSLLDWRAQSKGLCKRIVVLLCNKGPSYSSGAI
jgi:hypothetical protein